MIFKDFIIREKGGPIPQPETTEIFSKQEAAKIVREGNGKYSAYGVSFPRPNIESGLTFTEMELNKHGNLVRKCPNINWAKFQKDFF